MLLALGKHTDNSLVHSYLMEHDRCVLKNPHVTQNHIIKAVVSVRGKKKLGISFIKIHLSYRHFSVLKI